ncbi:hypothetical protein BY458DRAFT_493546 [Sporodiniella umbellata]|nr:hypothetical protein BY458DRAFT_493546 [Sporodiniella umbellata]
METSLASNRSYRLYIGHGNWVNLGEKTTSELLEIFARGKPARYELASNLFVDIIPHDVDLNSHSIDMIGFMRADLVYETSEEQKTQQDMSSFICNLLNDQNIVDAFTPIKKSEPLPKVTSISTHRHLSLIPSVSNSHKKSRPKFVRTALSPINKKSFRKVEPRFSVKESSLLNLLMVEPVPCGNIVQLDHSLSWPAPSFSYNCFKNGEADYIYTDNTSLVSSSSSSQVYVPEAQTTLPSYYCLLSHYDYDLSSIENSEVPFNSSHLPECLLGLSPPFNWFSENQCNPKKKEHHPIKGNLFSKTQEYVKLLLAHV